MSEMTMEQEKRLFATPTTVAAQSTIPEEEWYDLLPVEKKLIGYSLGLGIVLLVVFVFAFGAYH